MKRKYTAIVEIEDDCVDFNHGVPRPDRPLPQVDIINAIERQEIAGITIRVKRESFKRIPVKLPAKKKTEGQLIAARRKSGRIAAKGASKDFTISTPLKRYSRNTATPE